MGVPWYAAAQELLLLAVLLRSSLAPTFVGAMVPATSIQISRVADSLGQVTDLQAFGDDLYVATKDGRIQILRNVEDEASDMLLVPDDAVFLDISAQVSNNNERGLLGFAFHPNFATNGYFFVTYVYRNPFTDEELPCNDPTATGSTKLTRISRFTAGSATTSELVLAEIPQPYCNHNSGQLQFGPDDGYLYVATGDGGGAGDPMDFAENLSSILGKLLRVNVDTLGDTLPRWTIPNDNPDCGAGAVEGMIGYGLRNPWRFAFDRSTGDMWVADVGQQRQEEVNVIARANLLTTCHNFGWNPCEGTSLFEPPLPTGCTSCSDASCFVVPALTYGRNDARSITGGYVYRGTRFADQLDGVYFHADFVTGNLWGARSGGVGSSFSNDITSLGIVVGATTFGQSSSGEIFVATIDGELFRVEPTPGNNPSSSPSMPPSREPSSSPSTIPSVVPTVTKSAFPSTGPSDGPSSAPSSFPSSRPSPMPNAIPTPETDPSTSPSLSSDGPSTPNSTPSSEPSPIPTADDCNIVLRLIEWFVRVTTLGLMMLELC